MNLMIVNPGQTVQMRCDHRGQVHIVSNDYVIANNGNGNDMNENDMNVNDMNENDMNENDMNGNDMNENDMNENYMNGNDIIVNRANVNDMNVNDMNVNDMNVNHANRNRVTRNRAIRNRVTRNRVAQRSGRRQRIHFNQQQEMFFFNIIDTFPEQSVSDMRDITHAILNGNGDNYLEQIRITFPDTEVPTVLCERMDDIYGYIYNRCMR